MRTKMVLTAIATLFLVSACSKKEDQSQTSPSPTSKSPLTAASNTEPPTPAVAPTPVSAPTAPIAANIANDYSKPYLTEEKISKFIDSLKEDKNPFGFVLGKGGRMANMADMQAKMEEYNAFAKKYGFNDYQEYINVWGRITLAQTRVMTDEMRLSTRDMFAKNIANAEQQLKKPGLKPEMRKIFEDQVESGKKSLEKMTKLDDKPLINDTDFELFKTHKSEIETASKKFQQIKR